MPYIVMQRHYFWGCEYAAVFETLSGKIRVLSPIHIGSGEKIKKKEYIYMPWNHRVIIPNVEKMYEDVCARGWEKEFTSFLMDSRNGEMPLSTWLAQKKLREADYEAWKLYEMDAGEAFVDRTSRPKEIDAFVKDAYGLPYVPGSSVKGMFRTALLVWEIQKKPEAFWQICQEIQMTALDNFFSSLESVYKICCSNFWVSRDK